MRELPPTRVFFDGGMAAQMLESLDQYGSVEEAEAGMTSETFGSVASNRLWDGKGTTPVRPTNRWELKLEVHFATSCDAVAGERLLANVVGDYVDAPFESGKVSLYPQTASKGCEIWRFSTSWDPAASACRLRVRLRDAAKCNAYSTVAADDSVVLAATIADFEPRSTHSVVVRIKDPHVDTSTLGAPLGAAGVATTDGTEFEVYYDGVVLADVDTASHPNLVFPNNQLPGGAADVWFYTAYESWQDAADVVFAVGDRVTSFVYSYDVVSASGRLRRMQETIETHKYITASSDARVICACTDGQADTPCLSAGSENAWIKFDLGTPSTV